MHRKIYTQGDPLYLVPCSLCLKVWNSAEKASIIQTHTTMTNNEMLKADLLDILFEKRNKAYGAYALRRSYDRRLLIALGTGLAMALLFVLLVQLKGNVKSPVINNNNEGIVIREYVVPQKKIVEPEKPKQVVKTKAAVKKAQVKFTSTIEIRKDELVKTPVASTEDLAENVPGDETIAGIPDDGTVSVPPVQGDGNGNEPVEQPVAVFVPIERDPAFPGGAAALHQFLSRNLQTPDELEEGELILVKVKFRVDADGRVSSFEIAESGGREFDQEVLRVVKRMPRWEPAFQNGINVPVSFMIPVTFMGVE